MSESLLVGSKTRAALKAHGVNVGAGALEALNEVVHWYIDQAAKRAAANRRKTVRGYDFIVIDEGEAPAAEPPAPAGYQAEPPAPEAETGTAHLGGGYTQSAGGDVAAADAGEAVEEAAEEAAAEAPPESWSS